MTFGGIEAYGVKKFVVGSLSTNCYLIYEKISRKALLIDPGAYVPEIAEDIKAGDLKDVHILNTHGHADHIRGNAAFGFPVMIHELDASCLRSSLKNLSFFADGAVSPVKAERLLKDGDIIRLGEVILEIIHTPGHTPGGISVKCQNILFSGDTLFFEGVGRTDLPGGDHEALVAAIKEKLFALPDLVRVFPGHGPETTIGHEKRNNPFL